jgi:hypothetical protein
MIHFYFYSLGIFILYVSLIIYKFGIPKSISESSYLLGKNGNLTFWAFLTAVVLPMLIYWLDITSTQSYQFIIFISCASLCFTAITGRFRGDEGKMQANIHTYGTILCAILAQLWAIISIPKFWILPLCLFPIAVSLGKYIKGSQRNIDIDGFGKTIYNNIVKTDSIVFWVEIVLFLMAYISIMWYTKLN